MEEASYNFPQTLYFDTISYIPGDKRKALRKADRRSLDVLIMDFEDSYIMRDMEFGEQERIKTLDLPTVKMSAEALFWKWLTKFPGGGKRKEIQRIDENPSYTPSIASLSSHSIFPSPPPKHPTKPQPTPKEAKQQQPS